MFCQPWQRLRSCILHHPANVTFFVCIVTLGISFVTLGEILKTQPVRDADSPQDWDSVLQVLTVHKICTQSSTNGHVTTATDVSSEDIANVSVLATIILSPWQSAVNHSVMQIFTTGTQLGMRGPEADTSLTVTVSCDLWPVQCNSSEPECTMQGCISMIGPKELLPQINSSPQCAPSTASSSILPQLYVLEKQPSDSSRCYTLGYVEDPHLKNMVTKEQAVLCARRLQYSGFCILILGLILTATFASCTPANKEKWTNDSL